jgi:hypothetical protein
LKLASAAVIGSGVAVFFLFLPMLAPSFGIASTMHCVKEVLGGRAAEDANHGVS